MTVSENARGPLAGAGPGGLTAAYLLTKQGEHPGRARRRTTWWAVSAARWCGTGGSFDLGGHNFFTKVDEVEAHWHEILPGGEDFMLRPRMSRIYYKGQITGLPRSALRNVLRNIAALGGVPHRLLLHVVPHPSPKDESNYENSLSKRFG